MSTATTILNVDDTEPARYAKTRVLKHAGFEVIEVGTGGAALAQMESVGPRPTLVLLDVRLPDMSGIDVCKAIKARWPETVVLQTSATFVTAADRTRGLEGGADSYLIQPIDPDELVAAVRALLRMHRAEDRLRQLNESLERRIEERTRELREANANLVEQVNRRERAEAELVQAQKMEAIGQLTGSLAHDFNNILASMTGYINVIRLKTGDSALHTLLDKALAAAERGKRLTGRMLNFSRLEDNAPSPVDLGTSVLGMREWLAHSLGSNSTLQVSIDDDGGAVVANTDANQFELAILNLVINARDAMSNGGTVAIDVRPRVLAEPEADLDVGSYATVCVRDSGAGMTSEVAARAFDPFFTTKAADRGTGLGLAQVLKLCKASGGSARIESGEGRGTAVTLWMKAATATDATEGEPAGLELSQAGDVGAGQHILVVDDEDDIRETVCLMLVEQGYRVTTAASATDALKVITRQHPPDLVVLDYSMPGENGADAAKRFRDIVPALPILFLSGHASREALQLAYSDTDLLRKPFASQEFYAHIRRALAKVGR